VADGELVVGVDQHPHRGACLPDPRRAVGLGREHVEAPRPPGVRFAVVAHRPDDRGATRLQERHHLRLEHARTLLIIGK
jgi:hypothetical protein